MSAPCRLSNALTRSWVAGAGWAPHELAAEQAVFSAALTVKRSASRFFMYEEHRTGKLDDSVDSIGGTTELLQQAAGEFLDAVASDRTGYCYWTSPLSSVAPELLSRTPGFQQLHELPPLAMEGRVDSEGLENPRTAALPTDPRGPSIWIGSAGSSTQAHYDVADNVIVQLHGTKRLRCYPPQAATCLHVFPDAHPRARKSQVNFDSPDTTRFPLFAALPPPALDITLHPGDALSVPAFWFHHVENDPLGPSVSLNLFAPSAALIAAQPVFAHRNPVPSLCAGSAGSEAVLEVLCHLSSGLLEGLRESRPQCCLPPPAAFVRQLVASRYTPLADGEESTVEAAEALRPGAADATAMAEATQVLDSVLPYFGELRSAVVESCGEGDEGSAGYADAVVELVAAHLIELWAVQLVGAPDVGLALGRCFPAEE